MLSLSLSLAGAVIYCDAHFVFLPRNILLLSSQLVVDTQSSENPNSSSIALTTPFFFFLLNCHSLCYIQIVHLFILF